MNTQYFDNLTAQINNTDSCAELQSLATKALGQLNAQVAGIEAQMAALAPILALLTAPTNPSEILTWAGDVINHVLTPMYAPYLKYATELPLQVAAIANVVTALHDAADRITDCSITIP